jgi:hypothetical protein
MSRRKAPKPYLVHALLRGLQGGKTNGALLAARGAMLVGADVLFISVDETSHDDILKRHWNLGEEHNPEEDQELDQEAEEPASGAIKFFHADEHTFKGRGLKAGVKLILKELRKDFTPALIVIDDLDGVTGRTHTDEAHELSQELALPVFFTASSKPVKRAFPNDHKIPNARIVKKA